jgi:hypothetical protein
VTLPQIAGTANVFDSVSATLSAAIEIDDARQLKEIAKRLTEQVKAAALNPAAAVTGAVQAAAKTVLLEKLGVLENFLVQSLAGFQFTYTAELPLTDWQTLLAEVLA